MDAESTTGKQPMNPIAEGTRPGSAPAQNAWTEALLRNDGHLVHAARLAALGEIATGIAHEMNQPLAAIQMIVTSMLADLERGEMPLDRARQWLGTINEQIGRISWIIGHMRSFSRNEAHEPLASTALGDIVENTLGLLRAQLRSHGITIELDVDQPLPPVQADPRRLEQVLVNLLSNARDALDTVPSGAPRSVRISARAAPEGDHVVLEVADNGPGMPPDVRERIFEAFFTTTDVGKGTGLGLSIVRTIIDECDGQITVESQPGAGTTFRIELPRADVDGAQDNTETTP
jgi:C4-dicarboxylate-specific signal transduction histidine kinase